MLTEETSAPGGTHALGAPIITMEHVTKRFGKLVALDDVSLEVRKGEVLMIIGPSGSGKSTLLRCLNHLEVPESGRIAVDGIELNDRRVNINKVRAEIGMVFQRFELFPHLTVLENITLALRLVRRRDERTCEKIALGMLDKV